MICYCRYLAIANIFLFLKYQNLFILGTGVSSNFWSLYTPSYQNPPVLPALDSKMIQVSISNSQSRYSYKHYIKNCKHAYQVYDIYLHLAITLDLRLQQIKDTSDPYYGQSGKTYIFHFTYSLAPRGSGRPGRGVQACAALPSTRV